MKLKRRDVAIVMVELAFLACTACSDSTPEPGCSDTDGDGFQNAVCGGTDCNDSNAEISPDADEVCDDRRDNDCDDLIDEDDPQCAVECADADGDGHRNLVCGGDDCNDSSPVIHPGAIEICTDLMDNDCDGLIDDASPSCASAGCTPGDSRPCGDCGTESCGAGGTWGGCAGEGACSPGVTQGCGDGGLQTCSDACAWGVCEVAGECDPGDTRSCGRCGSMSCGSDGSWGACEDEGCAPGRTRDCGACGQQECDDSCEWGPCGNEGGTIYRLCNDCGWQFCSTDGSSWWGCQGHLSCPGGQTCNDGGWCVTSCTSVGGRCAIDGDCCSGLMCRTGTCIENCTGRACDRDFDCCPRFTCYVGRGCGL